MTNPLTPAEVNALQGRELDAAVRDAMRLVYPVPYSQDYTCAAVLEDEIRMRGLTNQYIEALSQVVAPEYASIFNSAIELDRHGADINGHEFMWRMAHATPEQRARAVVLMSQEIAAQDRLMHQMSDHAMGAAK